MVQLLQLLEAEAADMPDELSFLSSHPLTEERIEKAREVAQRMERTKAMDPELEPLFEALKVREVEEAPVEPTAE
jgi:predicted Zn-dependent protease